MNLGTVIEWQPLWSKTGSLRARLGQKEPLVRDVSSERIRHAAYAIAFSTFAAGSVAPIQAGRLAAAGAREGLHPAVSLLEQSVGDQGRLLVSCALAALAICAEGRFNSEPDLPDWLNSHNRRTPCFAN